MSPGSFLLFQNVLGKNCLVVEWLTYYMYIFICSISQHSDDATVRQPSGDAPVSQPPDDSSVSQSSGHSPLSEESDDPPVDHPTGHSTAASYPGSVFNGKFYVHIL